MANLVIPCVGIERIALCNYRAVIRFQPGTFDGINRRGICEHVERVVGQSRLNDRRQVCELSWYQCVVCALANRARSGGEKCLDRTFMLGRRQYVTRHGIYRRSTDSSLTPQQNASSA